MAEKSDELRRRHPRAVPHKGTVFFFDWRTTDGVSTPGVTARVPGINNLAAPAAAIPRLSSIGRVAGIDSMLCCYRDDRKRKKRVSLLIVTTAVTASRFLLVRIQLTSVRSCTHCERSGSTTYNNNCNFNAYPTFYNIGTSFALSMGARLFLRMHFIFYRNHGIPDNEGKPLTGRHSCTGWHRRSGAGSCAVVAAVIKTATRRPPHHVLNGPGTRNSRVRVLCLKCRNEDITPEASCICEAGMELG